MATQRRVTTRAAAACALIGALTPALSRAESAPGPAALGPPAPAVHPPLANASSLVVDVPGLPDVTAATGPEPARWPADAPAGPPAPTPVGPAPMQEVRSGALAQSPTESLPLGVGAREVSGSRAPAAADPVGGDPAWILRTVGALAVVVGLAVALRSVLVRASRGVGGIGTQLGAGGRAPSGLLSVLGRYPVARGQTLVLLKVDTRVLLLCQSSQGFSTLCEVTDPEDVASILLKARDEENESLGKRFGSMLRLFERDPSIAGHDGAVEVDIAPRLGASAAFRGAGPRPIDDEPLDAVGSLRRRLATLQEAGV